MFLLASTLSGEGCECHHGAFLRGCGIEVEDGLLSTVYPRIDLVLEKVHVGVVVGILAPLFVTANYDGEILDCGAEEMRPAVERILGAEVPEGPVGRDPIGLVSLRPVAHDKIGVAGCERVEHSVVDGANRTAQSFLGGLSAC